MAGGTRHFDLGKELLKRGYQVVIFASGFEYVSRKYTKIGSKEMLRTEELAGVQFVWLNTFPHHKNDWRRVAGMVSYAFRVLKAASSFNKPDVVIGSNVHPLAVLAGWWLARKYQARFIFEVRDLWPQTLVDMGAIKETGLPARLLYAWEKFMCLKAEKVIVLMPGARQYYENRGVDPGKICWIPNGVDVERYRDTTPFDPSIGAAQAIERHQEKFKVIYAGAHGQANGLEVAIEAAALISKKEAAVHFIFIGDGPEKQALREKAAHLGCANVTFCDPVPKAGVPAVLKQADLLILCIRPMEVYKYGVSLNKVNDYLASGRPVVMAAAVSNDAVAEAQAGLTVLPGDAQALADGILQLFKMRPEELDQLGANGRAFVEKYYDTKHLGETLAKILS
ncbi:MAG: glycosyltransferase family 4 protein [Syntrophomonadaceae bacterium]|nr:glycosyltransferase family 4 protein [Syntrophomonadaceae bacterium]